jgi:hypothetical protein
VGAADEPAKSQTWGPVMGAASSGPPDVGGSAQGEQQQRLAREKILSLLESYGAAPFDSGDGMAKPTRRSLFKRDEAHAIERQIPPNVYRLALEEARRLVRAQRRKKGPSKQPPSSALFPSDTLERRHQSPAHRYERRLVVEQPAEAAARPSVERRNIGSSSRRGENNNNINNNNNDLMIVPKRTDSSADTRPGSGIRKSADYIAIRTRGHHQAPATAAANGGSSATETGRPPDDSAAAAANQDEAMQCNLRHFTYQATKTDEAGNQCSGLVVAAICYGGCDTGEIADWLFPHKKSIHKVCRHGTRIRRTARLSHCRASSGDTKAATELDVSLTEYHYVDALDCVCSRCDSADMTCLGTMSSPHLQTLSEVVAEIGQQQQQQQRDESPTVGGD